VIPARIFSMAEVEFLFLRSTAPQHWEVLFPAQGHKVGDKWQLPEHVTVTLVQKGLPQVVHVSRDLDAKYFQRFGEMALPPYIQAARGQRHNRAQDALWYQTAWAENPGSVAAPTASLHFHKSDLQLLHERDVDTAFVTLHVGAGTFLPVRATHLQDHEMHREWAEIPAATLEKITAAKERGGRVWALGTTVARTLESHAAGLLQRQADGSSAGLTQLFIFPPYHFQVVGGLLTNFHQPKSTLFALVAAFAGLERAKGVYAWAIERRFRLFSYGDLTAWIKP
jgi:S-adenosylmethionine:tRNA ribosyltransferase-isomerase